MTDIEPLRDAAAQLHRAGRLGEAAEIYAQILATAPLDARAAHNLGLIRLTEGDRPTGLSLLAQAYRADPKMAWQGYAKGLIADGDHSAAEAVLAAAEHEAAQALRLYNRQAWARRLISAQDLAGAEAQLRAALALAPDDADTLTDLGSCLFAGGRYAESAAAFGRAVGLAPGRTDLLVNLAGALRLAGDLSAARERLQEALRQDPRSLPAFQGLTGVLLALDEPEAALALAEARLADMPGDADGALARGVALQRLERFDAAAAAYAALSSGSLGFESQLKLGSLELDRGQAAAAIAPLERALGLRPNHPDALFRRGLARLSLDDFQRGWRDYAARWDAEAFQQFSATISPELRARFARPEEPEELRGRRLLLAPEQGLGDEVMFASLVEDALRLAEAVTLICSPRLKRLFANSFPSVAVRTLDELDSLEGHDLVLPVGDLPRHFRRRHEDFPGTPYLRPTEAARARQREWLGPRRDALRVGLSWRGGIPGTRRGRRSVTLSQLRPLLALRGCEFVSLQYGEVSREAADACSQLGVELRVPGAVALHDLDDMAALAAEMDVVVSVQNTLVHLCGAIGQRALAMIPSIAEWRYGSEGSAMAWYRSVSLYRQGPDQDWGPVVEAVVRDLKDRTAPAPS